MKKIFYRTELIELARELGVRADWHESDEQDVAAHVVGVSFDNAGFWPADDIPYTAPEIVELHVILERAGQPVAAVNLATLFAWATGRDNSDVLRARNAEIVLREKEAEITELRAKLKSSARAASLARHPSRTASPAVSQDLMDGDIIREFDDKHIAHLIRRYGDGRAVAALAKPGDEAQFDEANREADALHAEVLAQFKTRLTEAEYRTKIAGEIRDRADEIALTGENRSLGHVLALLIRDVADRVGMMS